MPDALAHPPQRLAVLHRLVVVTVLGFATGLPLALTGQAMQAWLSVEHVDIATIGFLSIVGLPYTFKFLWAPLMDRFELPWLGRRRGWMVLTQLTLALALWWMAETSPSAATRTFALIAVLVAFVSASQDVVIDAYRTDLLRPNERAAEEVGRPAGAGARHRVHRAAGGLGGEGGALRDAARRAAQLLLAGKRARLPRLHRAVQARRRIRRLADDAVPAASDALHAG